MKSAFEKVQIDARSSVAILDRRLPKGIPFEWHHHPEFELTLTLNSRGHRFIGDHFGPYDDADLVLVGPNLPHTWCSSAALDGRKPHVAIVAWFPEAWAHDVVRVMPELARVNALLQEARRGLLFSRGATRAVRPLIRNLPRLSADARLTTLLRILCRLAADQDRTLLASRASSPAPLAPDPRLQKVLAHLHARFQQPIHVGKLAALACLSPSALHRMFRRHTRLTPIGYAKKLRIGSACSLLMDDNLSIAAIAAQVGYTNLSNFNRQFRSLRGTTPGRFRALHGDRMLTAPARAHQ